jgi:hypothetical protein
MNSDRADSHCLAGVGGEGTKIPIPKYQLLGLRRVFPINIITSMAEGFGFPISCVVGTGSSVTSGRQNVCLTPLPPAEAITSIDL